MAAGSATLEQAAATLGTSIEAIERKAKKLGVAFGGARRLEEAVVGVGLKAKGK